MKKSTSSKTVETNCEDLNLDKIIDTSLIDEISSSPKKKSQSVRTTTKSARTTRSTRTTKTSKVAKSTTPKINNIFNLTLNNDDNILEISLNENTYDIYVSNKEYNIFLGEDASSFSSTQQNLKLINGNNSLTIYKNADSYAVWTNSDIDFSNNVKFSNFSKSKDIISFNVANSFRIYSKDNKVYLTNELYSDHHVLTNLSLPAESNNTLIISEEDNKVYLPYSSEEVLKKFENNPTKYSSIDDLIEKEYILPNNLFKHPIRSRFREAFKLMRVKEHSSFAAALELAIELMFESHLNPAIITACKNLRELDIYLDCLDDNELDKFKCFKIVYKAVPLTV